MPDETTRTTQPERYPTVADVIAQLSAYPSDMPVACLADEFGTFWPVNLRRERLRWVTDRVRSAMGDRGGIWVEAFPYTVDNGTEREHVII